MKNKYKKRGKIFNIDKLVYYYEYDSGKKYYTHEFTPIDSLNFLNSRNYFNGTVIRLLPKIEQKYFLKDKKPTKSHEI